MSLRCCSCGFHFNVTALPCALHLFMYVLLSQDYASILEHLISRWELEGMTGLSSEAQEAQEYVCKLPPRIRRLADRTLMRKEKSKKQEVPFSWIYDRTINM